MSATVESAVHICVVLAAVPAGFGLPVTRLAAFHELAPQSLAKQLQLLGSAGIVEGTAGRTGGYRLSRPPGDISLLEIVDAIEGGGPAFRCREIRRAGPCVAPDRVYSPTCAIAAAMHRAEDAWRVTLREVTLADLAREIGDQLDPHTLAETRTWINDNRRATA